jgi:hypothetical protein
MKRRLIFSEIGEKALIAGDHSQMADAYEKVATDPRLTANKRQEYLDKARRARELSQRSEVQEKAWRRPRGQV